MSRSESTVVLLALCLLAVFAIRGFLKWFLSGPTKPDAWDESVSAEVDGDTAIALCHRCLNPHEPLQNFCRVCGAPVGKYTNLLPFPYLFSIGHTLRIGTSGEFRRSKLTIVGFFLLSAVQYAFLAPIFWMLLLLKLRRPAAPNSKDNPTNQPPVANF